MSEDQNLEPEGEEAVEGPDLSWVPEKFRENPQAFGEAYTNLERAYHSSRQEVKGLEESIQSLSTQFEEFTAAQSRPDPASVVGQWQEQYEVDPFSTTLQLAEAIAQNTARQILQQQQGQSQSGVDATEFSAFVADQSLGRKYEDWAEYAPKVSEFLADNPTLFSQDTWANPQATTQAADRIYQMVKAQDVLSGNSLVEQQAADTRSMKLNAQSAASSSGRTPAQPEDEWNQVQQWQRSQKNYWD